MPTGQDTAPGQRRSMFSQWGALQSSWDTMPTESGASKPKGIDGSLADSPSGPSTHAGPSSTTRNVWASSRHQPWSTSGAPSPRGRPNGTPPNRTRENPQTMREIPDPTQPVYAGPAHIIGTGGRANSNSTNGSSALESNTASLRRGSVADEATDGDVRNEGYGRFVNELNPPAVPSLFRSDRRSPPEMPHLNRLSGSSQGPSYPSPVGRPEMDLQTLRLALNDEPESTGSRLLASLRDASSNNIANPAEAYPRAGTQSWGGHVNDPDAYSYAYGAPAPNVNPEPFSSNRGGIADRGSPPPSVYQQPSPRNLVTPPAAAAMAATTAAADFWPQFVPHGPTMAHDLDSLLPRQLPQAVLQATQPVPVSQAAIAPFFNPSTFIGPGLYGDYAAVPSRNQLGLPNAIPPPGLTQSPTHQPQMHSFVVPRAGRSHDPTKDQRSHLLNAFRSNPSARRTWDLRRIYTKVVEFSGDQLGSRFIQEKLETANGDEKEQVFREIEENAVVLMKDVFGNYVIQKFFEHGNQIQKRELASRMKGKMVSLSMQMYACRVVQKAFEHVLVEQQAELVKEFEPDVLKVIKDQNGNHVIQKVIEVVPSEHISFIMDAFVGQVGQLATDMYACRVLQRILEYGSEADKARIMRELDACAQALITDQYGNYVIQHVIDQGKEFASNVVEKCIMKGSDEELMRIKSPLTAVGPDGTSNLQPMIKDNYGNYVIQKMIRTLQGDKQTAFIEEVKPELEAVKKTGTCTGRQITAVERLIEEIDRQSNNGGMNAGAATAAAPASPGLQVDVNSAASTPALTTDSATPQSSSPPSIGTNAGATEELVSENGDAKVPSTDDVSTVRRIRGFD